MADDDNKPKQNHKKKQPKIVIIPKSLKILPISDGLIFPHSGLIKVNLALPFGDIFAGEEFFVVVHMFQGTNEIPEVGTLVIQDKQQQEHTEDSVTLFLRGIHRLILKDARLVNKQPLPYIECSWNVANDPEITEEVWQDALIQTTLQKLTLVFRLLCMKAEQRLSKPAIPANKEVDGSSLDNIQKAGGRLQKRLHTVGRTNLGYLLDEISGFLIGLIMDLRGNLAPNFIFSTREILFEISAIKRLEKLANLIATLVTNFESAIRSGIEKTGGTSVPTTTLNPLHERYAREKEELPENVRIEIERLLPHADPNSATGRVHAQFIEWLLDLPWNQTTEDQSDFSQVRQVLETDHYGLEEVKARILEFLAVRKIKPNSKAPILCFVGPPGVGKTSLGESIAKAMGRKFIRRSLGGVKDEAEIRGHRRTYIGALPGMIIESLRETGSKNPVFMLDEIDKLGQHGSDIPAHALLEVLDPEQNATFRDHYIDLPFDLSQVLFITTANVAALIHETLLNRMEIIELPGYTEDEKVAIAQKHIMPKVHKDYGIIPEGLKTKGVAPFSITFSSQALRLLIGKYVNDAGMRDTERSIAKIVRKVLMEVLEGKGLDQTTPESPENGNSEETPPQANATVVRITTKNIQKYLGEPEIHEWIPDLANLPPGVAVVLMVAGNGVGKIGFVEISSRKDPKFDRKSTGLLSKVLKESVEVAVSRLIHGGGALAGASHKMFAHIHFPEGAIPKDGPSAGLQIFAAWYSMIKKIPLKPNFAATGEIVLKRNVVLPVGGIRAKLLAAERAGIQEVAIPLANRTELDRLPKRMRDAMRIITPDKDSPPLQELSRHRPTKFTVYCIDKPEDVLAIAFPDNFSLPQEKTKEQ